jgi:ATP-binding cassette, subfamily B, bacterial PglK
LKNLINLFKLFQKEDKRIIFFISILITINSIIGVFSVAIIAPFIKALSDSQSIESDFFLKFLYNLINTNDIELFLIYFALLVFFLQLVYTFSRTITDYFLFRTTYYLDYKLGSMLMLSYLSKPYKWFIDNNSSEISKSILNEVDLITRGGVMPFLQLLSHSIFVVSIFFYLFFQDPFMTLAIGISLLISYFMIFKFIINKLREFGKKMFISNENRFDVIKETFVGIKDVKSNNAEFFLYKKFSKHALEFSKAQTFSEVSTVLPKYFVELIAFVIIFSLIFISKNTTGSFNSSLPIVSLFLTAAYRVLPSLQAIYNCISKLQYIKEPLKNIVDQLKSKKNELFKNQLINEGSQNEIVSFKKDIILKDLCFKFPKSKLDFITNLNLHIKKGSSIAFVGTTGSGKTTITDIISGLLTQDSGHILIDDFPLKFKNLKSWRSKIGYVNQNVYLLDDSIVSNVAFGIPTSQINVEKVIKCLEIACINNFIQSELKDKHYENVGEMGVKLSGGQKQRIGIARALYRDPYLLIFDEATSALDSETQKKVVNSIALNCKKITTITIAHRISTVKDCDMIHIIEKGKIIESGNYVKLSKNSTIFKNLKK